VVASAEALLNREAISPVKRSTTVVENSSAMALSVQDATMHAPFATLVQSNVRENAIKSYF
jgi:hypothetical protein